MTRDARAIYFNDVATGPTGHQIPTGDWLDLEPDCSSEAAGVNHEATASRASQGNSFATKSTANSDFARETQLDR